MSSIGTIFEMCLRDIAHSAATSPLSGKQPSFAQISAGVFKKGHITIHGMRISIENPQGSIRRGTDKNGKAWACAMHGHYGYFKGTVGADGNQIDCFLGPDCENPNCPIFVINQVDPDTGIFDEHKVMIGYCDLNSAIFGYNSNYTPGWKGLGTIDQTTIKQFRNWMTHGDTSAPFEPNLNLENKQMKLFEEAWKMANEARLLNKDLTPIVNKTFVEPLKQLGWDVDPLFVLNSSVLETAASNNSAWKDWSILFNVGVGGWYTLNLQNDEIESYFRTGEMKWPSKDLDGLAQAMKQAVSLIKNTNPNKIGAPWKRN